MVFSLHTLKFADAVRLFFFHDALKLNLACVITNQLIQLIACGRSTSAAAARIYVADSSDQSDRNCSSSLNFSCL